jgi:hypothetical protein
MHTHLQLADACGQAAVREQVIAGSPHTAGVISLLILSAAADASRCESKNAGEMWHCMRNKHPHPVCNKHQQCDSLPSQLIWLM